MPFPKKVCPPKLVKMTLFGEKKVFEHVIKDLEMGSCWIRVGPKSDNRCP